MTAPASSLHLTLQRLAAVTLALLALALLRAATPGLFASLEQTMGDWLWRSVARAEEERRVVIVDIDEASIARVGPWPWPREKVAALLTRLNEAEASEILLDVFFDHPAAGDAALGAALRTAPVVTAQLFNQDSNLTVSFGALSGAIPGIDCPPEFMQARTFFGAAPGLGAEVAGHVSPRKDGDGTVRRIPALACFDSRAYPALGVAAFMRSAADPFAIELTQPTGLGSLLQPHWWLRHKEVGVAFPLDAEGNAMVGYGLKRDAYVSIPAADLLEGRAPADWLRGAWVIIGSTSLGLGDVKTTPLKSWVGGVEVHAHFLSSALDGRIPFKPRGAALVQGLAVFGGILFLLWLSRHSRQRALSGGRSLAWALPAWGLALSLGMFLLHALALWKLSWWLGFAEGACALAVTGLTLGTLEHAQARREWERLFGHLSSYLPAPIAAALAQTRPSSQIEATRCEVTVLVADIRNFSAYVEGRPPEESGALLHAFFTGCARLVKEFGGEIDQFSGDAVVALWNASTPCPDAPVRALDCAEAMQAWFADRFPGPPPPGLEPLALGIGLETGPALAGSFGPLERRVYTALGESVTVARRLEGLTRDVARPILVGNGAKEKLGERGLDYLGEFLLEGLRRPHRVWSPPLVDESEEFPPGSGPIPLNIAEEKRARRRMSA